MIYLRYTFFAIHVLVTTLGFLLGGTWTWLGFAVIGASVIIGDSLLADDLSEPNYRFPIILDTILFSALPLLLLMNFTALWLAGDGDTFGFGSLVSKLFSIDPVAARASMSLQAWLGVIVSGGFATAVAGANVAHELYHRPDSPLATLWARWILATYCDGPVVYSHLYNHHPHVVTARDHSSARRGESSWSFVLRSVVQGNQVAWRLESRRLQRRGKPLFTLRNGVIRAALMSASLVTAAYWMAGGLGVAMFFASAAWAKILLEFVNYIEHYGLVRAEEAPIELRHSWNSNHRLSQFILVNLPRHAHHHTDPNAPFFKLKAYDEAAPRMPYGYMTSIVIAMVPPLWYNVMAPALTDWDDRFASEEELMLLRKGSQFLAGTAVAQLMEA